MPRGKKQILSDGEMKDLKAEKGELEGTLKGLNEGIGAGTAAEGIDKGNLANQIKRLDKAIQEGSAPKLRGNAKDDVAKEAAALESKIKEGMLSRDEMQRPHLHPGAIQRHQEWERRNRGNIEKWKQAQRVLEGGSASNIERLRRS